MDADILYLWQWLSCTFRKDLCFWELFKRLKSIILCFGGIRSIPGSQEFQAIFNEVQGLWISKIFFVANYLLLDFCFNRLDLNFHVFEVQWVNYYTLTSYKSSVPYKKNIQTHSVITPSTSIYLFQCVSKHLLKGSHIVLIDSKRELSPKTFVVSCCHL